MNQTQFKSFWEQQSKEPITKKWDQITDENLGQIKGDLSAFNSAIEARYTERKEDVRLWANPRYAHWTGWYEGYK